MKFLLTDDAFQYLRLLEVKMLLEVKTVLSICVSVFHSYLFICELFILSIVAWFGFRRCEDDFKVIQTEVDPPSFDQVSMIL